MRIDQNAYLDLENFFQSIISSIEGAFSMFLDVITSSEGRYVYLPGLDEPLHLFNPLSYLFTNSHDTHKSPEVKSSQHPIVN